MQCSTFKHIVMPANHFEANCGLFSVIRYVRIQYQISQSSTNMVAALGSSTVVTRTADVSFMYGPVKRIMC